jgi:N-terminal acetyltransferase B complex non-catalytic subunit
MTLLVRNYFDSFGNKACCFEDLKPYLTEPAALHEFITYLESISRSFVSFLGLSTMFAVSDH